MNFLEKLVINLQQNHLILLIMFLISLIGGVMSIILGWKQFYEDYLSKKLTIPVWLFLILYLTTILKPTLNITSNELKTITGKSFGVQQIHLDGYRFVNCRFNGSELVFAGRERFELIGNNFDKATSADLTFIESAKLTLGALMALYKEPVFRESVEKTFSNIRNEKIPLSTPIFQQL